MLRGWTASPVLSAALPKKIFPPRFNRYGGDSNFYGQHVDNAVRFAPGTRERVRTDLSCTVFLSDPADYDGGELSVHEAGRTQQVKLAAGSAVALPGHQRARGQAGLARRALGLLFLDRKHGPGSTSSAACCLRWTWP